jgi:hypothetical protein
MDFLGAWNARRGQLVCQGPWLLPDPPRCTWKTHCDKCMVKHCLVPSYCQRGRCSAAGSPCLAWVNKSTIQDRCDRPHAARRCSLPKWPAHGPAAWQQTLLDSSTGGPFLIALSCFAGLLDDKYPHLPPTGAEFTLPMICGSKQDTMMVGRFLSSQDCCVLPCLIRIIRSPLGTGRVCSLAHIRRIP